MIQVGLSVYIHRYLASRHFIGILPSMGVCASYSEARWYGHHQCFMISKRLVKNHSSNSYLTIQTSVYEPYMDIVLLIPWMESCVLHQPQELSLFLTEWGGKKMSASRKISNSEISEAAEIYCTNTKSIDGTMVKDCRNPMP